MKRAVELGERIDVSPALDFTNLIDAAFRSRRVRARLQAVVGLPLTATDVRVLRLLDAEPVTISAAAERIEVDISRASRHLARLVDIGVLKRESDPLDGRFSTVLVTEKGRDALRGWQAEWERDHLEALAAWTEADVDRFVDLVDRFHRAREVSRGTPGEDSRRPVWHRRSEPAVDDPRARRLLPLLDYVEATFSVAGSPVGSLALVERARSPVGPTLIRVLSLVASRGPLGIRELAERTDVAPSRASRHVQQLEEHQLVVRAVDPHDRRSYRVKATSKGNAVLRRVQAAGQAGLAENMADWPEKDVADLMAYFARLTREMRPRILRTEGA